MDVATLVLALGTLVAGLVVGLTLGRGSGMKAAAERDALRGERDRLHRERESSETRARRAEAEAAATAAALDSERAGEVRLREAFAALSGEALARNNEAFVQLAEARLREATTAAGGDLDKRQQAIEGMVAPLRETLGKVEEQIREVERGRVGAYSSLLEQVATMRQTSEQLRTETAQLVTALRAPQIRGRWGELQLRRVVESAGMLEHCDFTEQPSVAGSLSEDDRLLRPDLVVHLAGGKNVVVDAKVAFSGFLEASEARDEATRAARLKAHARHLRTHVDQLAAKAYWERFASTPEFVVCFVPADVFLDAALQQEPGLLEHAFERNVVIATPSTLMAMLRTVGYAWRQESLARNAREVHDLAREFYTRLATMGSHVDAVGTALNSAVNRYNKAVSSLESRVLVSARKLRELRVTDDELPSPRQVESAARSVEKEVLVSGDTIVPLSQRPRGTQGDLLGGREASGS